MKCQISTQNTTSIVILPTTRPALSGPQVQGTQSVVGPCALGTPNKKLVPRKICTKRSTRPMQLFFSFDKESSKLETPAVCLFFFVTAFFVGGAVEQKSKIFVELWETRCLIHGRLPIFVTSPICNPEESVFKS